MIKYMHKMMRTKSSIPHIVNDISEQANCTWPKCMIIKNRKAHTLKKSGHKSFLLFFVLGLKDNSIICI